MYPQDPKNLMIALAWQWYAMPMKHVRRFAPVEMLDPEKREILKHLTSDDIADVRWPPYDELR